MKKIILVIGFLALNGCSLIPFADESACSLEGNYGQCINGEQAYEEAISGEEIFGNYIGEDGIVQESPTESNKNGSSSEGTLHSDKFSHVKDKSFIRMKDSIYNEIKGLVDEPITPMLRPTKVVSTLILNYQSSGDKTNQYMPRYVISILKEPEFILNQYMLKQDQPTIGFFEESNK